MRKFGKICGDASGRCRLEFLRLKGGMILFITHCPLGAVSNVCQ